MSGPEPPRGEDTTVDVRRAQAGDAEALERLVRRLWPLLVADAGFRLRKAGLRSAEPEDVASEAWAAALPKLAGLGKDGGRRTPVLLAFLSTAVRNVVGTMIRRREFRGTPQSIGEASGDAPPPAADATGVVTAAARAERHDLVHAALARLDEIDRDVLLLRGVEQRSPAEVAALLDLAPSAATMRYKRALERLRAELPDSVFADLAEE